MNNDFSVNSIEDLRTDLAKLDEVAAKIDGTLKKLQTTYSNQQEGYASANSERQAETMNELSTKAQTIAENVQTIKDCVGKYATKIEETDQA